MRRRRHRGQAGALALTWVLATAPACFAPPRYEGLSCNANAPCPAGFNCWLDDNACHAAEEPGDASTAPGNPFSLPPDAGVEPPGTPTLVVTPEVVDFGTLDHATTVAVTNLVVRNIGSGPLVFAEARIAAGSSALFTIGGGIDPGEKIASGTSAQLGVIFTPGEKDGESSAVLEIATSDPRRPVIQRTLTARRAPLPVDPGCDEAYPVRLWPVAASVSSCAMPPRSTTGPEATDWIGYSGCATWVEFQAVAGKEMRFDTRGDGCQCTGCLLWHINYDLQEDLGAGLETELHVQVNDGVQCPGGIETANRTLYVPRTSRVRMSALANDVGSMGYYFSACSAR